MTIGKTLDEMLRYLESLSALDDDERGWVEALGDYYRKKGFLTPKQRRVIEDIYFRYTMAIEVDHERFIRERGEDIEKALAEVPETDPEEDPS